MSQKGKAVHPVRRRAGLLSALAKLYGAVQTLLDSEGTAEEAIQIQQKLHERYTAYLDSHETALVDVPEREASLNTSHIDIEQRHQQATRMLQAFINDGTRSEGSLHLSNIFSSRSSNASVTSENRFQYRIVVVEAKHQRPRVKLVCKRR